MALYYIPISDLHDAGDLLGGEPQFVAEVDDPRDETALEDGPGSEAWGFWGLGRFRGLGARVSEVCGVLGVGLSGVFSSFLGYFRGLRFS